MHRQLLLAGSFQSVGKSKRKVAECTKCHRAYPPDPPSQLFVEHGVDENGRPFVWEYTLKRTYTNREKEPGDTMFRRLEDAGISASGLVTFNEMEWTRKATPRELSTLSETNRRSRREIVRKNVPVEDPTPQSEGTTAGVVDSSAGGDSVSLPAPPPGHFYVAVVSTRSSS